MKGLSPFNILLLGALGTSTKQNNQCVTVLRQIDAVPRSPIDNTFADARKPFHAHRIAEFKLQLGGDNLGGRLRVQGIEPRFIRVRAIRSLVFFNDDFYGPNGNTLVTNKTPAVLDSFFKNTAREERN